MARAIFTSQTPGFANESDGAPGLTIGTVFSTSVDADCSGIWWYFPTTLPGGTVTAHLYDESDQTQVATATFSGPVAGTWNLATFAAPVTLSSGNNYVASVWTPDRYVATGGLFNTAITNGTFTAPADDAGLRNGRFAVNASPTYPNGSFGANGYLVDVDIDTVEDVSGTLAANLGGVAAALTGTRTVRGNLTANPGGVAGAVQGTRTVRGTASAALGGLTATLAGKPTVRGTATATLGAVAATLAGSRTVHGLLGAALGGITATLTATGDPCTVTRPSTGTVVRPNTGIVEHSC